ncbi:hypothetical protein M3Y95_01037100 [Aphelenchoides besseyi]|nr:hypothetical protein M3Y95_01037100 [Aphelenchoides besseyi]
MNAKESRARQICSALNITVYVLSFAQLFLIVCYHLRERLELPTLLTEAELISLSLFYCYSCFRTLRDFGYFAHYSIYLYKRHFTFLIVTFVYLCVSLIFFGRSIFVIVLTFIGLAQTSFLILQMALQKAMFDRFIEETMLRSYITGNQLSVEFAVQMYRMKLKRPLVQHV